MAIRAPRSEEFGTTTGPSPVAENAETAARRRRVILFSTIAALGGFLFGYDTAVINGAVGAVQAHFQAGPLALGTAVASALIGSAIGAWFAGPIADRIGRVRTMLIAAGLFMVGSVGTGIAVSLYDFSAWRIIGGVAVGMASVIAPAYIAEIAPAGYPSHHNDVRTGIVRAQLSAVMCSLQVSQRIQQGSFLLRNIKIFSCVA